MNNKKDIDKKRREYRRTKNGLISNIYNNQLGNSKRRGYKKPTYNSKELKEWLYSKEKFHLLYENWKKSGFKKDLVPSVDRIDDYKRYSFDNIQLMTWEENKEKGHNDIKKGINNKMSRKIIQYDLNGNFIKEWYSINEAGRNNFGIGNIFSCCKGNRKTHKGFVWKYKEE